jgi:hypothetical protein
MEIDRTKGGSGGTEVEDAETNPKIEMTAIP